MKVSGAFHGWLSNNRQKKITKVLKLIQFPCADALSYAHFCEGRIDVVIQCMNKIWDIHPLIPIIKASGKPFGFSCSKYEILIPRFLPLGIIFLY